MSSRFNRLTATDLMFLRLETDAWPCHFGGLAMLEGESLFEESGELRLAAIKQRLDDRLTHIPDLRQRVLRPRPLGGKPVWVDDEDFSIDNHIRVAVVPNGEAGFLDTATEIYTRPLDSTRPLWEIWLLTGLDGDRAGVLLKLHHAVADGLAAMAIMGSLFDFAPDAEQPKPRVLSPVPIPKWSDLVRDNLSQKRMATVQRLRSIRPTRLLRDLRSFGAMSRGYFGKQAAAVGSLNDVVRAGRLVRYVRIDLGEMKHAAHARGGKVNDVALTLWAGGIRRLLTSRDESVDVDLVTGMATTLRASTGAGDTIDNRVGTMVLRLPLSEADPVARLDTVTARTVVAKENWRPAATMGYLAAIAGTPIGRAFVSRQKASNTIVTNVMGPPVPVYFFGARILEILPIIELVGNIGLTLCAFSYCGEMYLVVTADKQAFPDIDSLVDGMEHDWQALAHGTGADRRG